MRSTPLKCENCGARLPPVEAGTTVDCEFCHAATVVEAKGPLAFVQRGGGLARVVVGIVVLALVGIGLGMASFLRATPAPSAPPAAAGVVVAPPPVLKEPAAQPPAEPRHLWVGSDHSALLVDVNADGIADVIGRVRMADTYDEPVSLAAFDGESGKLLWKGPPLGTEPDIRKSRVGLAAETLLWVEKGGSLHAFSARDGTSVWTVELPEWNPIGPGGPSVPRFCQSGEGQVKLRLTEERSAVIKLADGQVVEPAVSARGCVRLADDGKWGDPNYDLTSARPPEGMSRSVAVSRAGENPTVVIGSQMHASQPVPLIAALFKDRKRNWKSVIPATRPDEAGSDPQVAAMTATRVYTVYNRNRGVLVSFDLADGTRQWEAPLPDHRGAGAETVQARDHRVVVTMSDLLQVYDATSGKALFTIGGR